MYGELRIARVARRTTKGEMALHPILHVLLLLLQQYLPQHTT